MPCRAAAGDVVALEISLIGIPGPNVLGLRLPLFEFGNPRVQRRDGFDIFSRILLPISGANTAMTAEAIFTCGGSRDAFSRSTNAAWLVAGRGAVMFAPSAQTRPINSVQQAGRIGDRTSSARLPINKFLSHEADQVALKEINQHRARRRWTVRRRFHLDRRVGRRLDYNSGLGQQNFARIDQNNHALGRRA